MSDVAAGLGEGTKSPRITSGALVLLCLAGALAARSPAFGQGPARFQLDRWTTDQGLPSHTVQDIAQTADGYLWITTTGGLVRFDGRVFRPMGTGQLPNPRVFGIDDVGDSVLVLLDAYGLYRVAGDSVLAISTELHAWDVARDGAGVTWVLDERIRYLDSANRLRTIVDSVPLLGPLGGPGARPRIWRDARGDVWIHDAYADAAARLRTSGPLRWLAGSRGGLIVDATRGEILLERRNGRLIEVMNERSEVRAAFPTREGAFARLLDRHGRVWVSRGNVMEAFAGPGGEVIASLPLAIGANANVVTEDREGNIWIGTPEHGLYRIQATPFAVVDRAAGFDDNQVLEVGRGDGGSVLAWTRSGKLFRVTTTMVRRDRLTGTPSGQFASVTAATTDPSGTRWLGLITPPRTSVPAFRIIGQSAGRPDIEFSIPRPTVQIVTDPTDADALWFASADRVHRAARSAAGAYRITASYTTAGLVNEILVDRRGRVWVTGIDSVGSGRLTRIANATATPMRLDGLPSAHLRAIHEDADGAVWIGSYGAGITRIRNDSARTVTARNGLFEDVVSTILEDDAGNLWIGGNRSVHRVRRSELNGFLDGSIDRVNGVGYGRGDGLLNPEGSGGRGVRTADGRLWFPTFQGVAVVDPAAALALDATPPSARVVALRAGGEPVDLAAGGGLSAGQRQLEFSFAAVALRSPERVRAAYRLDGVDHAWTLAGPEGLVTYRGLSPGRYTFRVRALNAGGVWSAEDAAYPFTIAPYVHEQRWFAVFAAALALALVYAGYTLRVRALTRRELALTRRVEERTAQLEAETRRTEDAMRIVLAQAEQLRSLDAAKSRLVANVSHEFRTPLSLVIGPLEDVRDGRSGPISEDARRRLDRGLVNARRLGSLVDQLLDAALLEAGTLRLRLETADLVGHLRRLSESFSSMAERARIRFRIATPVGGLPVRLDPDQLDKVFTNLLGNAFKFTDAGGEVTLEAWREGEGASAVAVVTVRDTGIGIGPDHVPRVFDRFFQADDSHSRTYEGAGLGLAITKELVELHGGTIAVESEPGRGALFTVRLPLSTDVVVSGASPRVAAVERRAAAVDPHWRDDGESPDDAPAGGDSRKTVLLVEDNAELRAYLRDILADAYRVLEAGRGDEALELARQTNPDLIVSDIMMPGMDGQALCEAVKADDEIGFVPVILLTAKASLDNKLTGLQGGADDYLTKPVDRRELLVRIENIIRSRQRLRERFAEANRDLPRLAVAWKTVEPATDIASADWLHRFSDLVASELANDELDADQLAERMGMSRSTLYRQTERLLGRSPMAVVWDSRLSQAALWLAEADTTVSEVAYAVGFKSVPHFSTRFRARFGESPSALRNRMRAGV